MSWRPARRFQLKSDLFSSGRAWLKECALKQPGNEYFCNQFAWRSAPLLAKAALVGPLRFSQEQMSETGQSQKNSA
jgi:hypothetical protein